MRLGSLNDLWYFDPIATNWELQQGRIGQLGISSIGAEGDVNSSYTPQGRHSAFVWTYGFNIFVFGGTSTLNASSSSSQANLLNDVWKYSLIDAVVGWSWIGGSSVMNDPGYYGLNEGQIDSLNIPPSRSNHASCVDSSGNIYVFGGRDISGLPHCFC
jgi:hypothetical protein